MPEEQISSLNFRRMPKKKKKKKKEYPIQGDLKITLHFNRHTVH